MATDHRLEEVAENSEKKRLAPLGKNCIFHHALDSAVANRASVEAQQNLGIQSALRQGKRL